MLHTYALSGQQEPMPSEAAVRWCHVCVWFERAVSPRRTCLSTPRGQNQSPPLIAVKTKTTFFAVRTHIARSFIVFLSLIVPPLSGLSHTEQTRTGIACLIACLDLANLCPEHGASLRVGFLSSPFSRVKCLCNQLKEWYRVAIRLITTVQCTEHMESDPGRNM